MISRMGACFTSHAICTAMKRKAVVAALHVPESRYGDYEALPAVVQALIAPREWLWLSDVEKARFSRECTEPEVL